MDIEYLIFLQNLRETTSGIFDSFFIHITTYGQELILMMITAAIYWCVDKEQGIFTFMTWGMGRLMNGFLKATACSYRPWIRDSRVIPVESAKPAATGYSFPSGHTINATSVFGSFVVNKNVNKCLKIVLIFLILLIGFSRNYLGVHYPQDVIVAFLVTALIIFFIKWVLGIVEKKSNFDIIVLVVGILINIFVIAYAALKGYPMDYDTNGKLLVDPAVMAINTYNGCGFSLGVLISWFIDRRWLHFEIKGQTLYRITYYIIGILGYLFVLYVIIPMLPNDILGFCLDRFIQLVYIMLVVPFIINLRNKNVNI